MPRWQEESPLKVGTRASVAGLTMTGLITVSGCAEDPGVVETASTPPASRATTSSPGPEATSSRSSEEPSSSAAGGETASTGLTGDQLHERVLDAVRAETSVHAAAGNLNPPPVLELDQDYSSPDGDLEATFRTFPEVPPIVARRAGGRVYLSTDGKTFKRVPEKAMRRSDAPIAHLVRTDVLTDMTALFAAAVSTDHVGPDASLGERADRYRLRVDTDAWFRAQAADYVMGIPRGADLPRSIPVTLWVNGADLPVRVEVRYSPPLDGIEGTGTARIDYSRWSEPIRVERPAS